MSRFKATLAALTISLLGASAQTAHAATDKNNTTVTSIQTYKDAIFLTLAAGQSGESCAGGASVAIIPNATGHTAFAQIVSTVLAAFLSGRTVDVRLEGCASAPSGGDMVPFVKYFTVK